MNRIRLIPNIYDSFNQGLHNSEINSIKGKIWVNLQNNVLFRHNNVR